MELTFWLVLGGVYLSIYLSAIYALRRAGVAMSWALSFGVGLPAWLIACLAAFLATGWRGA